MAEGLVRSQPIRTFFRMAGLAVATLLAGCQTVIPRGASPATHTAPEQQAPVVSGLPEDQQRQRIALLVPLTGPNAGVGQSIANAANLAIIDTGGKRVRVTTYDTSVGAAAAAQKAVAEGNRLFLGPLFANDVRAVSAVAAKAGIPVISFSNDSEVAGANTYLLGFSPAQAIDRVVRYARSRGATKFAGLMPAGLYGRNASKALIKSAEGAGGSVVAMQSYERTPAALAAAVQALGKDQRYEAVLIADSGRIAVQAVPLIRKGSSPSAQILGTELWNADSVIGTVPTMGGAWYASVSDGMYHQLVSKYRARFGKAPYRLASLGYDAVLLAIRIAADWRVGTPFPVQKLTDPGGFAGVDGAFRFGSSHIAERALEVHEVGSGGGDIVSPAPKSFAD
jgi:ABC-type branched-subunit amino acid transport system substrate-binding protein